MSKFSLLAAVAALSFAGCGDLDEPSIAGGESAEVMSTVSELVVAPVGPGGEDTEVIVQVHHDPGLDPEVAARLIDNIRVIRVPTVDAHPDTDIDQRRLWGADVYWHDGQPYTVSVEVDPVDESLRDEEFLWEWANLEVFFEHCPGGYHPLF